MVSDTMTDGQFAAIVFNMDRSIRRLTGLVVVVVGEGQDVHTAVVSSA
jgi:hypothetical protein